MSFVISVLDRKSMVIPELEHFQILDLFVMSLVLGTGNSLLMTNFRIVKVVWRNWPPK